MSEMVDRVAQAIADACADASVEYDRPETFIPLGARQALARAAIAAMREPTDEQYAALSATGKRWRDQTSETVWKTFIDAALKV